MNVTAGQDFLVRIGTPIQRASWRRRQFEKPKATLALCIGTVFILKHSRRWAYGLITFIPALFMVVTTFVAGVENIIYNYLPKHTFQGNLNAVLSIVMLVLVIIIFFESLRKIAGFWSKGLQNEPAIKPHRGRPSPDINITISD